MDGQPRPSLEIRRLRGGDLTWKRQHGVVGWRVTYPHRDGGLLRIGGRDAHLLDKFGQTKPEIFAEDVNGKRASLSGHLGKNSLERCISNTDIVGLVVSEWEAGGAPELVNACCADAAVDCTCPNCLALDEQLSGATPHASIDAGYQHAVAGLMAHESYASGRKTTYDHARRTIRTT